MTQALDAIPIGDSVEFKGPIGKFEYLGNGKCEISGKVRNVKKFIMICGGSGITPIFQILRAVLKDNEDPTRCLVLDGNRLEEDILCRENMDRLLDGKEEKCRLVHLLSNGSDSWTGLRGWIGEDLLKREVGRCERRNEQELILICGPEAFEKSIHGILNGMGWKDEDLMFF